MYEPHLGVNFMQILSQESDPGYSGTIVGVIRVLPGPPLSRQTPLAWLSNQQVGVHTRCAVSTVK